MVGEVAGERFFQQVIFFRRVRRAIWTSTFGLRSPATSAASMSRPETPKMSVATTLSEPASRAGHVN